MEDSKIAHSLATASAYVGLSMASFFLLIGITVAGVSANTSLPSAQGLDAATVILAQANPTSTSASATLSGGFCPALSQTLARGSRDINTAAQVSTLQNFLASKGLLSTDSVTGYFGPLTESAVQNWQASNGVVSSGSAASTGWGSVGPRTRLAILRACAGQQNSNTTTTTNTSPVQTSNTPSAGTVATTSTTVSSAALSTAHATPTSGTAPLTVNFEARIVSAIDFGDGQSQNAPLFFCSEAQGCNTTWHASHTYNAVGVYVVKFMNISSVVATQAVIVSAIGQSPVTPTENTTPTGSTLTPTSTGAPGSSGGTIAQTTASSYTGPHTPSAEACNSQDPSRDNANDYYQNPDVPNLATFLQKSGASVSDAEAVLYLGRMKDLRDWTAIMASSNPLNAARQATGALYNSGRTDYVWWQSCKAEWLPGVTVLARTQNFVFIKDEYPSNVQPIWRVGVTDSNGFLITYPANSFVLFNNIRDFGLDASQLTNLQAQLDAAGIDQTKLFGSWPRNFRDPSIVL